MYQWYIISYTFEMFTYFNLFVMYNLIKLFRTEKYIFRSES